MVHNSMFNYYYYNSFFVWFLMHDNVVENVSYKNLPFK